jgi:hypothetical protein
MAPTGGLGRSVTRRDLMSRPRAPAIERGRVRMSTRPWRGPRSGPGVRVKEIGSRGAFQLGEREGERGASWLSAHRREGGSRARPRSRAFGLARGRERRWELLCLAWISA